MTTIDIMKTDKIQREELMYEKQMMNNTATLNSSKNSNRKRPQTGSLNARGNGNNSSKGSKIDVGGQAQQVNPS